MEFTKEGEEAASQYSNDVIESFSDRYQTFIQSHKTEREVIKGVIDALDGVKWVSDVDELHHGETYASKRHERNLAVFTYNGLDEIRAIGSHVDSPCLHLKPFPVQEEDNVSFLKSHYYGGIKPYQWLNIPLSLRGVAYTEAGERVTVNIGSGQDDPVFTIPDLLPHLSQEQLDKKMKDAVRGEDLNALAGNRHGDDEDEALRHNALRLLHEEYDLTESDLVGAELRLVPQTDPNDVGFDRSLITGYGHDDRSSVYTSLQALLTTSPSDTTSLAVFYDKEEIGSEGTTGAKNQFWNVLYEDILSLTDAEQTVNEVWANTKVLSADVTAASNPNFNDVQDKSNAALLGRGVSIKKYTGSKGKAGAHDASAEFTSSVIQTLQANDVPWQSGVMGKIHIGGGGTIAKFIANRGAKVLDIGVPVLGMHAPQEVLSKADLYSAYQAFSAFYKG